LLIAAASTDELTQQEADVQGARAYAMTLSKGRAAHHCIA
jgi:hypothetical protein